MPHFLRKTFFAIIATATFWGAGNLGTRAQCLSGGSYTSGTPACPSTATVVITNQFLGEYSTLTLSAGNTYTISSSVSSDYLTLSNAGGTTALSFGTGSITYAVTTSGSYRIYMHANSSCGTSAGLRDVLVACSATPLPCLTATYGLFPSATFTPTCTGAAENITSSAYAGEYSNVNLTAGQTYTFTSSNATDYLTISNVAGTTGLSFGVTPVTYTPGTSGVYRFYTHTDAACGASTTLRTRAVSCAVSPVLVNATGGTASAVYTTVGAAFTAINAGTHTGAITVTVSANTTEAGPCVLNSSGAGPASYTSVTVRPGTDGVTVSGPTVTGRGLIELNGADNVTIDGDNPNTAGTNRNLTITNTAAATTTFTMGVRVAVDATIVTSADNVIIRNLNVNGSATGGNVSTVTSTATVANNTYGIYAGGGASTVAATTAPSAISSLTTVAGTGATISSLTISNNAVNAAGRGIAVQGSATTVLPGLLIDSNFIGNPTAGNINQVYSIGITAQGTSNGIIRANTIYVEGYLAASNTTIGIAPGLINANSTLTVQRNKILRVRNNNTGTYPAMGINLAGGSNHVVRNNFVSDILNSQTAGTGGFGTGFGAYGIRVASGTDHQVYHNTVHMSGAVPGVTSDNLTVAFMIVNTAQTGMDVRNNIFSNQLTGGNPTGTRNVAIYLPSGATATMNLTLNNNAYFGSGDAQSRLAQVGPAFGSGEYTYANFCASATTPATNLRAYISPLSAAGTNGSASFAVATAPPVTSTTDLHIPAGTATILESAGAPIASVTVDIDNEARSATTPDIGADEFSGTTAPACNPATVDAGILAAGSTSVCNGSTVTLTPSGFTTTGAGLTYSYAVGTTSGGPYTTIAGATSPAGFTTAALATGTYYYIFRATCGACGTGTSDSTAEVAVTVNAPALTVDAAPDTICAGGSSNLTATSATAVSFAWTPAATLSSATGATVTATPTGTTTYTVTAADAASCSTSANITVAVSGSPTAPTTGGYSLCQGGTIPAGMGLTAATATTGSVLLSFNVTAQPTETNSAPGLSFASATLPLLPIGATITSIVYDYDSLTALASSITNESWESDIRLGLSGALINAAAQGAGTADDSGTFDYSRTATTGITTTGSGTVNLLYWDSFNDNAGAAEAFFRLGTGVATVTVNYTLPSAPAIQWYTAATGGTPIGTGSPFNPIGVAGSGVADANTPGATTFYAEANNGACGSSRTPAVLTIDSLPAAPATTAYLLCQGATVPVGEGLTGTTTATAGTASVTLSFDIAAQPTASNGVTLASTTMPALPAGTTITSVTYTVNGVTAISPSYTNELTLRLSGAINDGNGAGDGTSSAPGTFNYTRTSTGATLGSGSAVNLVYSEFFDDASVNPDANFPIGTGVATVVVTYSLPATIQWYTAATGGTPIGSGTVFNPIGVAGSGVADANTPGTYTFYAEALDTPCVSASRTAAVFTINGVSALVATAVTFSSADLSWTATPGSAAATYTVEYGPSGFALGTGTVISGITGTSATVTGLNDSTAYDAYVRSMCTSTMTASVGPTTFTTLNASCSSAPVAGTLTSNDSTVCSGQSFTLTLTGFSTDPDFTVVYQSAAAGSGTFSAIAGATGGSYITTQTAATDYRVVVTCTASGVSDTSDVVPVAMDSFLNCYCLALPTNTGDEEIFNVTFGSLNNSSTCATTAPGPGSINLRYANYKTSVAAPAVSRLDSVAFSVEVGTCGGNWPSGMTIFIDYNRDGDLTDAGEFVYAQPGPITGPFTVTGTIAIPADASTGVTLMRVIDAETYLGTSTNPCATYGYGETEDYLINILDSNQCTMPMASGVASTDSAVCSGTPFTLSMVGMSADTGLSYQWQVDSTGTGTAFVNASGASTGTTFATTVNDTMQFRFVVTCANTGLSDTSAALTINLDSFLNCYCGSVANNAGDEEIFNVTFGTLTNTSSCATLAPGAGSIQNRYSNYKTSVAAPSVAAGSSTPFSVQVGTCGGNWPSGVVIFIDLNRDGDLTDAGEQVYADAGATTGPFTASGTIAIPTTADTGMTLMRVMDVETYFGTSTVPCGTYGYGETEDYLINILPVPPTPCAAPSGITVTSITSTSAVVTYTITGTSTSSTIEYGLTGFAPGTGTMITGATNPDTLTGLTAGTAYQVYVRNMCSATDSSQTGPIAFNTLLVNDNAAGALPVTVGTACSTTTFTNVGATQSAGEPFASCNGSTAGFATVWYKFTAPASGAVRVSNDYGGTLGDSRLALFSATDSANYSTFSIIGCDDDNGVVSGARSTLYATGLTGGATYWIQVDGYNSTTTAGTFCLQVDVLDSAMLATSGSCVGGQGLGVNLGYTGWTSLVDFNGDLIALVRNTVNSNSGYTPSYTVDNAPGVRQEPGLPIVSRYYLDRNWLINAGTTNTDVQVFFTAAELAALTATTTSSALASLEIIRQTGTACQANLDTAAGVETTIPQSGNGASGEVRWVAFTTPAFSNFYLAAQAPPLSLQGIGIAAKNEGRANRVVWTVTGAEDGIRYELDRSADGRTFSTIAQVAGTAAAERYEHLDVTPGPGLNHYRIRATDASGAVQTTRVVTVYVASEGSFAVEVFPNPFGDKLVVRVYGDEGSEPSAVLTDAAGRVIEKLTVVDGLAEFQTGRLALAAGVYFVRYSDGARTETIRVIKQ